MNRLSKPLMLVERPIAELKPDPRNPRTHSTKQVAQIAESIATFGFLIPILLDENDRIIAGHGRLLAARKLGMKTVPAISVDHLTPAQVKAYQIADNRLTENSAWDDLILAETFKELSLEEVEFSLDVTGFELPEIDFRIQSLVPVEPDEADPADEVPALDQAAVSRPGQLWLLGDHRIYCGNTLDEAPYTALLKGEQADFIFTDPPYNVPIQGHVSGNGAVRHREFGMASGEMSEEQFTNFLRCVFERLVEHSRPGSIHDICMDWRHLSEIQAAGKAVYTEQLNLCVWAKTNGGMGSLYRSQHEFVLVYKNGSAPHLNNVQLGKHGRNRSNVWSYPGVNSFGRGTEEGNLLAMHPTVKPVALVADAIMDCSNRGDLVLDVFLGSGSTLIACERTGRRCRGVELDPLYVDTAIRRWQKLTGRDAVCAEAGLTFTQCAMEMIDA